MKRRTLYGAAGLAWVGGGIFLTMALRFPGDSTHRTWLIAAMVVAGCLTTASLLVAVLPTHDAVYRAGVETGRRMSGCSAFPPALAVVNDRPATVTPIRPIRSLHTDN